MDEANVAYEQARAELERIRKQLHSMSDVLLYALDVRHNYPEGTAEYEGYEIAIDALKQMREPLQKRYREALQQRMKK
jgi:hypothetical protein